jgi:hypothetical protein
LPNCDIFMLKPSSNYTTSCNLLHDRKNKKSPLKKTIAIIRSANNCDIFMLEVTPNYTTSCNLLHDRKTTQTQAGRGLRADLKKFWPYILFSLRQHQSQPTPSGVMHEYMHDLGGLRRSCGADLKKSSMQDSQNPGCLSPLGDVAKRYGFLPLQLRNSGCFSPSRRGGRGVRGGPAHAVSGGEAGGPIRPPWGAIDGCWMCKGEGSTSGATCAAGRFTRPARPQGFCTRSFSKPHIFWPNR